MSLPCLTELLIYRQLQGYDSRTRPRKFRQLPSDNSFGNASLASDAAGRDPVTAPSTLPIPPGWRVERYDGTRPRLEMASLSYVAAATLLPPVLRNCFSLRRTTTLALYLRLTLPFLPSTAMGDGNGFAAAQRL